MKKIVFFILINFLTLSNLLSQNETVNWYFGNQAGIQFSIPGYAPSAVTDGHLSTLEGCAAISDQEGNLLFYTDGVTVWNKDHEVMPNGIGLTGHESTTQSALIVPVPLDLDKYYIFTLDYQAQDNGLRYSMVDMALDGGKGDVYDKNIELLYPCSEKMTAVRHSNGIDYWVIVHGWLNNTYSAYRITPEGIGEQVTTDIGSVYEDDSWASAGYLKASPDGETIASVLRREQKIEVFSFDRSTGELSSFRTLNTEEPGTLYGTEFSQDGSKLYVSSIFGNRSTIYQFDMSAPDPDVSREEVFHDDGSSGRINLYAMQSGPDGKIYASVFQKAFLAVINEPNLGGAACDFRLNGIDLSGRQCEAGLPNMLNDYFNFEFSFEPEEVFCVGDDAEFSVNFSASALTLSKLNYRWEDSGGSILAENEPLTLSDLQIDDSGIYQLIIELGQNVYEHNFEITVMPYPATKIKIVNEEPCSGDPIELAADPLDPELDYIWSTGDKGGSVIVSESGTYSLLSVNSAGCSSTATIDLDLLAKPDIDIDADGPLNFCRGDSVHLFPAEYKSELQYSWSSGESSSTITAAASGVYSLFAENQFGCRDTAFVTVTAEDLPNVEIITSGSATFCRGDSAELFTSMDFSEYNWNTGKNSDAIFVEESGTYTVEVADENGCRGSDTIEIFVYDLAEIFEQIEQIDLGEILIGETFSKEFEIENPWNREISISEISNVHGDNFIFEITPPPPASIGSGGILKIKVTFTADTLGIARDSVIISTEMPCSREIVLHLTGTGIARMNVSVPDLSAEVGNENFAIPLYARLMQVEAGIVSSASFSAEIEFPSDSYYPENGYDDISFDNNITKVKISSGSIDIENELIKIGEIRGLVLLPAQLNNLIEIIKFDCGDKYVKPQLFDGSLLIDDFCAREISQLELLEKMNIELTPNPASDNVKLNIENLPQGMMKLLIISSDGRNVFSESQMINEETDIYEKSINTEKFPSGLYRLIVRSAAGAAGRNLIIVR